MLHRGYTEGANQVKTDDDQQGQDGVKGEKLWQSIEMVLHLTLPWPHRRTCLRAVAAGSG